LRRAVLPLLLAVLLAACGGSTVTVKEVPGPPVALDEPGNAAQLAPTATATATATPSATATTTPSTGTGTGTTGSTGTSTGSGTPSTGTGTQTGSTGTSTQPPPAGSDAQKFEQFCAQNPGAC
jgi:hypothetical protein